MTGWLITIFVIYCLISAFDYWLDRLNIRHLEKVGDRIPEVFAGLIDQALLTKTRDYTVAKNRLGVVSSLVSHGALIAFIFCGLLSFYSAYIQALHLHFIVAGVVFFLGLTYAQTLISLPFSWYASFKLEARFGFNTMTGKVWLSDLLKSLLLSTIVLSVLCAAGLFLVQTFPKAWWIFVWGFFLLFSLFMMYISPYVLEPLFNKYTPVDDEGVAQRIKALMEKAGLRVSRVFKMDASKRSRHTNAYFTGIGKVKRIVLYDTLLEKMTEPEILAVLAHEVGHWKKKHVLKRLVVWEGISLAGIYLAYHMMQSDVLLRLFHVPGDSFYAKVVLSLFLFSLVSFPFNPLSNFLSRRDEREADRFAFELTGSSEPLIQALVKLSKDNLSNLHPHPWYAAFHYSHPPVVRRIRDLRSLQQEK